MLGPSFVTLQRVAVVLVLALILGLGVFGGVTYWRLKVSRGETEAAKAETAKAKLLAEGFKESTGKKEVAPTTGPTPEGTHVGISVKGATDFGPKATTKPPTKSTQATSGECICPVLLIVPDDLRGGCASDVVFDGPKPVVRSTWWAEVKWFDHEGQPKLTRAERPITDLVVEHDSDLPLPAGPSAALPPPRTFGWEARAGITSDVSWTAGASFYPKSWPRWVGVFVNAQGGDSDQRNVSGGIAFRSR